MTTGSDVDRIIDNARHHAVSRV
ncbi:hypothetical protein BN1708_017266 [Verticillium longisporum]|uniref:Uncharacterized protein n=1 Tax=Verticillium longisporum TaxID=100787 RepID=A0A0G4KXL2_VERLO|nr:hypothetical protein BN1708_017266 [Verticillium longisporum]